jgi:hypothetical protein
VFCGKSDSPDEPELVPECETFDAEGAPAATSRSVAYWHLLNPCVEPSEVGAIPLSYADRRLQLGPVIAMTFGTSGPRAAA